MIQEKRGFSLNGDVFFPVLIALHLSFILEMDSGHGAIGIVGNLLTGLCWPVFL